eukprot:scaffold772_cov361-Prasinococcus_capsulatus_cf.AAC.5
MASSPACESCCVASSALRSACSSSACRARSSAVTLAASCAAVWASCLRSWWATDTGSHKGAQNQCSSAPWGRYAGLNDRREGLHPRCAVAGRAYLCLCPAQ